MTDRAASLTVPEPAADGLPNPRRMIAVAALVSAIVMSVVSGVIANVALPTIAATLQVSEAASIWIANAYQLGIVVTLFPLAALGESRGYRPVFVGGLAVFTASSALCAMAPDFTVLVAGRSLQGLGAGAQMAVFAGMLRYAYPQRLLGLAIGINALFASLSSAVAPTLGAAILTQAGWSWLFAVNVPIGIVALLATPALPKVAGRPRRTSPLSILLNALALALVILAIDRLGSAPLTAIAMLVIALIGFGVLVARELGKPLPLVPLDLLRIPVFRLAVLASFCAFGSQMMAFVAIPFLLHDAGYGAVAIGYLLMPWPLTVALAALIVGRLADRYATAVLCGIGGFCIALSLASIALWRIVSPGGASPALLVGCLVLGGLGFGLFQTPNNRTMLLSAPRERSGAAGSMQAMARQFGQTACAAIVSLIFSWHVALAPALALAVAAVLAVLAAVLSFLRR
jgi:DHA2 family multidrug resistance protein-like MFS transporter